MGGQVHARALITLGLVATTGGCAANQAAKRDLIACQGMRRQIEQKQVLAEQELEHERGGRALAEHRDKAFAGIEANLREVLGEEDYEFAYRDDTLVLQLPSDYLFKQNRPELSRDGQGLLRLLAPALATIAGRRVLIAGHTDSLPVNKKNRRFKSNRELTTQLALSVAQQLEKEGMAPERLAVAGYGEHLPVADNDSDYGRAENRRIEIVVLPLPEEIPQVPKEQPAAQAPAAAEPPPAEEDAPPPEQQPAPEGTPPPEQQPAQESAPESKQP